MIKPETETRIFREIEQILKENRDSLLTKEVHQGCPCNNQKKRVFINNGAQRIAHHLDELERLRITP